MLEHHIYSIITDRTAGMKELDQLISDNILKKIYITTRDDDTAIIFVEDYKKLINDIIKKNRTDQRRKINILKIYFYFTYNYIICTSYTCYRNISMTILFY